MPNLLQYRAWQGTFHSEWWSVWPIARVALGTLVSRWLFRIVGVFSLKLFLMFFFGAYLLAWFETQASAPQLGNFADAGRMIRGIRRAMQILNGSQDTFQYFFAYQGAIVVVMLSLVGSLVVGNDFTHKSLVFYLAKPINRWQYLAGKGLAVFVVVQIMTTLPALVLFAQHAFDDWGYLLNIHYFTDTVDGKGPAGILLLFAILGYGTLLSVFLSIILVATASWARRTIPLIMVWLSLFFFMRILANLLVDGLRYDPRWRLIDLWNNLTMLGQGMLGFASDDIQPKFRPELWEASLVLFGVSALCLIYLNLRTRGVEIVR
ncbi:MAG: hypothetical protein EXS16_04760 [Gemmataceae bacterium]|nr:hypothetical protein [Gemmataceae bacterium]